MAAIMAPRNARKLSWSFAETGAGGGYTSRRFSVLLVAAILTTILSSTDALPAMCGSDRFSCNLEAATAVCQSAVEATPTVAKHFGCYCKAGVPHNCSDLCLHRAATAGECEVICPDYHRLCLTVSARQPALVDRGPEGPSTTTNPAIILAVFACLIIGMVALIVIMWRSYDRKLAGKALRQHGSGELTLMNFE